MPAPVAIAVVSFGTRDLLDACLTSLRPDAGAGLCEVWVVDNGSTDGSPEMVEDRHPWATLLRAGRNLGYGPAVNEVAARTGSAWIAAANSDLRFAPGALRALLRAGDEHPRTGALAPRLVMPDGRVQHSVHPFPSVRLGLLLSCGLATRGATAARLPMEGAWDPDVPREVDWAHGALLLVRRAAWDEVGGFDPGQHFYAEDLDLCWRLARAGWSTRYVPDAVVHHEVSASAADRWPAHERAVRSQRSAYAWMLARQGAARTRMTAVAHLAGPAARAAVLSVAARRSARLAAARDRQLAYVAMHRTGLEPAARLQAHRRGD